jgi:hypothetical protein
MSTMPSTNDDSAKSGRVLHGRRGERQMLGRQAQLSLSLAALCVGPSVTQSAPLGHHRTGRTCSGLRKSSHRQVGRASLPCGLTADYHPASGDDANPALRNAGGSVNHRLRGVIRAARYV